jgi:general secretion pathway protein B
MSYILEALKKAQAERQLGSAPTIHAPQPAHVAPAHAAASRKSLLIGVAAGVLVAAAAAVAWRHQAPTPVSTLARASAPAEAPVAQAPVNVAAQPTPPAVPPAPAHADARATRTTPAEARPAAHPRAAEPAPVAAPPAPVVENVRTLADLPEAVQREVPKVAFGGYIYSPNPADRLLLIDKTLRHEGEEVAPGLVLEKLLPTTAVMNYRGNRYRVAY